MENKIHPELVRVHPDFQEMLKRIQQSRIDARKETVQYKVALWKLTKTISNMIEANKDIYDSLVEVRMNGSNN